MLDDSVADPQVEYRRVEPAQVLAIRSEIDMAEFPGWLISSFTELHDALDHLGLRRAGPDGALYSDELFELELGEVVAFVQVSAWPDTASDHEAIELSGAAADHEAIERPDATSDHEAIELPGAELAVMVHEGSFDDLDQTYGKLGSLVAGRGIGLGGPIREYYLVSPFDTDDVAAYRTEVCWPVFQTTGSPSA
jgi:effector-binding domain-containing protein